MLSEEKIKKMIRLSDYENGQGGTDLKRTRYLKMDYIRLKVLKTFVSVTAATLLILVLLVMYHAEYVLKNAMSLPFDVIAFYGGGAWLVMEILFIVITCRMASREYEESRVRVKEYYATLQDLLKIYEKEEQEQEDSRI
ncbi:MAG: hypothetical protein J1F02_10945 [Lachnospiraceae bacterium]|nr:hypothetical protein [Lachnospiraceae bacterium]